ncbi:MAG: glycosyltransferase family 4 protein [Chloroflexota bacterium]|nr:glycosyltransferase family 4 protein [Chloroflexota bacterium]
MRIGFLSTRLSGTDGVSLEVEKWTAVLHRMGHEIFFCAGELGGYAAEGMLVPLLHFQHPRIERLTERAFGNEGDPSSGVLTHEIEGIAGELLPPLREWIRAQRLDLLIVENALAIPMNLPFGVALTDLVAESGISTIGHHHDFYWERARYQNSAIFPLLDRVFPPNLPSMRHVTINSIALRRLRERRGIVSVVIPNVHNFATPPPRLDEYNRDVRESLGLKEDDLFVLQPTRVIQRKGIEMAIELVHLLDLPNKHLLITHSASDEGQAYWEWLRREANSLQVDMRLIDDWVAPQRATVSDRKVYSLWDIYPHADLVTYPSTYEGFGNALLEAIYFKRLIVINRYPVYNADIAPLGFEFIELDGFVSEAAVQQTQGLLGDPERVAAMTDKNYAIAREHFSLEVLESKLRELLASFSYTASTM